METFYKESAKKLSEVRRTLRYDDNDIIIAIVRQGSDDEICVSCPELKHRICTDPDSYAFAAIDEQILKECRMEYGEWISLNRLREFVSELAPLKVCRMCRFRDKYQCGVSRIGVRK